MFHNDLRLSLVEILHFTADELSPGGRKLI